jgi:hypothetical protein
MERDANRYLVGFLANLNAERGAIGTCWFMISI